MTEKDKKNSKTEEDLLGIPKLGDRKSEIFSLIKIALDKGASDIHISAGNHPVLRIDGKLIPVFERPKITPGYSEKLIGFLLTKEQKEKLEKDKELDFSYVYKDLAFLRVNVFFQKNSMACVIRLIPSKIRTLEELNLPSTLKGFTKASSGLVLLSGPTGSGKSSTIAALLEEINRTRTEHIITVEDPIEYVFKPKQSIINQREVRSDTLSFKSALLSALREDFNVLLVGELRDVDSIEAAITIAETGHLVFATVHASIAEDVPDRIIGVFPPFYQPQVRMLLSNVLLGIVAQKLVPKLDGGRVPAIEVMLATRAVKNLIREGKTDQLSSVIETSSEEGMVTFKKSIENLIEEGKVSGDILKK